MLILQRSDISGLLDLEDCTRAVEDAFRLQGEGRSLNGGRRHVPAGAGGFHVAIGGLPDLLSIKVNANFPPIDPVGARRMSGAIYVVDASTGEPVALLDSRDVTLLRTAAVTTIAIRNLARRDAETALLVGAGRQAEGQIRALQAGMSLRQLDVWDRHPDRALEAATYANTLGIEARAVDDAATAARSADVIVTATPAKAPLIGPADVAPGTTVVALGADQPGKQELDPRLLARAKVVVDVLEQCLSSGELRAAVQGNLMSENDVYGELGEIVARKKPGRVDDSEIVVFDSTGTGLQDAAAAMIIVAAARKTGRGIEVSLSD